MRLPCHLRMIRGERTLRSIAEATGVNHGEISRIEHGTALPKDKDIESLERAYGAPCTAWYPARTLLAIEGDGDEQNALRSRLRVTLLPEENDVAPFQA